MSENEQGENMLDMARRNLFTVRKMYPYIADDDGMVNIVGYHLEQTVELALKHYLETHGIKFPFTHDISVLTELVPDIDRETFAEVENMAANITNMEAKTRYVKNYRLSLRLVDKTLHIAEKLLQDIAAIDERDKVIAEEEADANDNTSEFHSQEVKKDDN
ncbi:MAG: HEPN domain-containing protein [Selenomonadaceae bacterium]|nr:HEPN domain-containing protein [Selenomonadaceae bacterium]